MSWYNFGGSVQGGYGVFAGDDIERKRRRRDAYRDAGSPYQGGSSGSLSSLPRGGFSDAAWGDPSDNVQPAQAQQARHAPRQAAAVDMGQGVEQPSVMMPQHATAGGPGDSGLLPQHATKQHSSYHTTSGRSLGSLPSTFSFEHQHSDEFEKRPAEDDDPGASRQHVVMPQDVTAQPPPDAPAHVQPQDVTPTGPAARAARAREHIRAARKATDPGPNPYANLHGAHAKAFDKPDRKFGIPEDKHAKAFDKPDRKFEIKDAAELRRIAAQDPAGSGSFHGAVPGKKPTPGPTPGPTPDDDDDDRSFIIKTPGRGDPHADDAYFGIRTPKPPPGPPGPPGGPDGPPDRKVRWADGNPLMPQDVTPSRPSFKLGKLGKARRARNLYRDHARRMEEKAARLEDETDELKRGQVQIGNMLRDTRLGARREKQRVIQQMRKQNRQNLADMYSRHRAEARRFVDWAGRDRERLRQEGMRQLQFLGDHATARMMRMQQQQNELGRRAAGLQQQLSDQQQAAGLAAQGSAAERRRLQQQLKRQQEAANTAMRTNQATRASMQDEMRRQQARAGERERVAGAKLRSQQDRIAGLTAQGNALLDSTNKQIASLHDRIRQGTGTVRSLRDTIAALQQKLRDMGSNANRQKDLSDQDKRRLESEISRMSSDLDAARADLRAERSAPRGRGSAGPAGGPAAPIVVQGGSGGGGASSSAGGSSASSGGGGAARQAAPDLGAVVQAVRKIAEDAKKGEAGSKKKGGSSSKGITQARRSYTDKRKSKLAELRALKTKRIREFEARTKKMKKAERDKARREFKKKVNSQFKEAQQQFPTARGLKSVSAIRELIRKLDAFKPAK